MSPQLPPKEKLGPRPAAAASPCCVRVLSCRQARAASSSSDITYTVTGGRRSPPPWTSSAFSGCPPDRLDLIPPPFPSKCVFYLRAFFTCCIVGRFVDTPREPPSDSPPNGGLPAITGSVSAGPMIAALPLPLFTSNRPAVLPVSFSPRSTELVGGDCNHRLGPCESLDRTTSPPPLHENPSCGSPWILCFTIL